MNIMYPKKCMVYLCADVVYIPSVTGSKKSDTIVNFYPAKYVHAMVDWPFSSKLLVISNIKTTVNVFKTKIKQAQADLNIGKSGQMGNSGNVDCQSSYTPSAFLPIKQITSLPHSPSSHLYFLGWNLDRQLFFAPLDISKPVDLIFGSPFPVNGIFFVDINIGENRRPSETPVSCWTLVTPAVQISNLTILFEYPVNISKTLTNRNTFNYHPHHIIRKILFRVRPWFRGFLLTSLWGCNIILICKKSTTTLDDKQGKYIRNIREIVSEVRPLFPVEGRPSYPFVSPPTFKYSKVANTLYKYNLDTCGVVAENFWFSSCQCHVTPKHATQLLMHRNEAPECSKIKSSTPPLPPAI